MKRKAMGLVAMLVILFSLSAFVWKSGVRASAQQPVNSAADATRTISVSGTGTVQAQPDQAIVRFGVQTDAESANDAMEQTNNKVANVLDELRSANIARENIQTQTIQLYPRYSNRPQSNGSNEVIGYTAANTVQVQVNDLNSLGGLLDAVVQAGANRIDSISFQVSDPSQALDQAREAAMNDARHKAEQLANLADAELGSVLTIQESSQTPVPVSRMNFSAEQAAAAPVEPGTETLRVDIQVTWTLTDGSTSESGGQTGSESNTNRTVEISPMSGPPGSQVTIHASGFPANTPVNLGIGRWRSEYDVVSEATTSANGSLEATVEIPSSATANERWVIVVASQQDPQMEATSGIFLVTSNDSGSG